MKTRTIERLKTLSTRKGLLLYVKELKRDEIMYKEAVQWTSFDVMRDLLDKRMESKIEAQELMSYFNIDTQELNMV